GRAQVPGGGILQSPVTSCMSDSSSTCSEAESGSPSVAWRAFSSQKRTRKPSLSITGGLLDLREWRAPGGAAPPSLRQESCGKTVQRSCHVADSRARPALPLQYAQEGAFDLREVLPAAS